MCVAAAVTGDDRSATRAAQDAAGEGLDLGDNEIMDELQEEIIDYLENN